MSVLINPETGLASKLGSSVTFLGTIGQTCGLVASFYKNSFFWSYPYPITFACLAIGLIAIYWPRKLVSRSVGFRAETAETDVIPKSVKQSATVALMAVTILVLIFVAMSTPKPVPHRWVEPPTTSLSNPQSILLASSLIAGPKASCQFIGKWSSLAVDDAKSDELIISPETMLMDRLLLNRPIRDQRDDALRPQIVDWLKKRCMEVGVPGSMRLITETEQSLIDLSFRHSDIVEKLMPKILEFEKMSDGEKDIVMTWLARYVGSWKAHFRITVDNSSSSQSLLIKNLQVEIYELGGKKGSFQSELRTLPEVDISLPYKKGTFTFPLITRHRDLPTVINAKSTRSFDLIVYIQPNQGRAPELASWKMKWSLGSSQGAISLGKINLTTINSFAGRK